jgi:hypothetical protein
LEFAEALCPQFLAVVEKQRALAPGVIVLYDPRGFDSLARAGWQMDYATLTSVGCRDRAIYNFGQIRSNEAPPQTDEM